MDYFKTLELVSDLAKKVGSFQKKNLNKENLEIDTKSTSTDLVTEIDKKSDMMIIEFLRKNFPTHSILTEESGEEDLNSDYLWVIDPLDGTTNFSQGLPIFAVSIALQYKRETVLGVVYLPILDELFTAIRGNGAYKNGEKMRISQKTCLQNAVLATGFPYDVAIHPVNNLSYFNSLVKKTRAIRRFGAAAYDLALVAAGKFDGYWEMTLGLWDAAAAVLLVEEAGGKVVHFRNDRKISIVAGNEIMVDLIWHELKKVDAAQC